jgi:hypothetical protein
MESWISGKGRTQSKKTDITKARKLESTKKGLFFYKTPSSFVSLSLRVFVIILSF